MRHLLITIALLATILPAAATGAAEPTAPGATAPKAASATAPKPKAKPAPASRPAAQADEQDERAVQELLRLARGSFVVVRLWYKKDMSDATDLHEKDWRVRRIYDEYIARRCPEEFPALVLDNQGHVLMIDDGTEKRFVDRIEVRDAAGKSWPAARDRMLLRAPGIILKLPAEAAKSLRPLTFAPFKDEGPRTSLLQAHLYPSDDQWHLRVSALGSAVRFLDGEDDNLYFGYRGSVMAGRLDVGMGQRLPAIIADAKGRPVGCALTTFLDLKQADCAWRHQDICQGESISFADLDKLETDLSRRLTASAHEVILTLRQSSLAVPMDPTGGNPYLRSTGTAAGQEIKMHGLALGPQDLLVPQVLDRKVAAQVDSISVELAPGQRRTLKFVGAYKQFGAFLLRLEKGTFPSHVELLAPGQDLPAMQPFWAAVPGKRFGQTHVRLMTSRLIGKARGYGGKFHDQPAGFLSEPAFLVDMKGRLAGLNLTERIENEEERQLQLANRYFRPAELRVFHVSEVREALTAAGRHLDDKIQVMARSQAKRRAWFGVEFVPITPDVAEQLKVEQATKDGKLGFLVNAVYDASPAQKLGVRVGDILLRLQVEGMAYPIDLAPVRGFAGEDIGGRLGFGVGMEGEEGEGMLMPTWKNRENFLTQALDAAGVGRKVTITACRSETGDVRTIQYTVEQAPPDLEAAPRWKNVKLGLTVKDMTYEVRYAMNLARDAAGVVLAKVEQGSPTLVAKIFPFEIITHLDDKPLTTARQMRDRIAQARKAGRDSVRLTVLRLGRTRFADLAIGEYDPADDEGLDEE